MAINIIIIFVACIAVLLSSNAGEGAIGVNWGRQSAQRLLPSQVVDLLLQNGVKQARIYTTQEDVLQAFAGSGISLIITVYSTNKIRNMDDANTWVQRRAPYLSPCNIRYVIVGDYDFWTGITHYNFWTGMTKNDGLIYNMNVMQDLQNALDEAGYGDQTKTIAIHLFQELKPNITKPSEAEFRDEIKEEIAIALRSLKQNNAPFAIEMFPFLDLAFLNISDLSFVFADNKSTTVVKDINGAVYTNIFEFEYDSIVWALRKAGVPDLEVIVTMVGWPTDGAVGANTTTAEYFYKCLLPLVVSNKGTPMRPGKPIETFVHELGDENKMTPLRPWARHWGIYRSNGEPKYKIDLSGQGRDIYPTSIRGIMRMPSRWCMFNGNTTDLDKVVAQFNYACEQADCTSLTPGGSCGHLSFEMNVSYAFNMYFQFEFQDEKACGFGGLGYVSVDDPSTGQCVFPVEVVKGHQDNFYQQLTGNGFHLTPDCAAFFVFVLSILTMSFWD